MLYETVKWELKKITNIHKQHESPNIFMFSSARSGSTWLMEIIATQNAMKLIDEPLLIDRLKRGKSPIPPSWEFLLPNPDRKPLLEDYFNKLIHNQVGIGSPKPFSRFHKWSTQRIVFKIFNCKDLMNWFEEKFYSQVVYLVRHPIPTNLSRKRYKLLPLYLNNDEFCNRYLSHPQRKYCENLLEKGSNLQKKTLDWCLQNLAPLKFLDRSRWFCIHYEDIVMNPEITLDKLSAFLFLAEKEKLHKQYFLPSNSTTQSAKETLEYLEKNLNTDNRRFLINKWHKKVSQAEEEQVFEILHKFGIDIYDFGKDEPANRL